MPSYRRGRLTCRLISDTEITELYASGLDADTISYRAGCSGSTVLAIVRASGGAVRSPGSGRDKPLLIDAATICKLYCAGESGPMIASKAGCVPSTVYRVLRQHGVTMRDTGPRTAAQAAAHARKTKAAMIGRRRESRERGDE